MIGTKYTRYFLRKIMVLKIMRIEQNDSVKIREIKFDMFFMNFDGVRICSWMFLNFEEKNEEMIRWPEERKSSKVKILERDEIKIHKNNSCTG